MIAESVAGVKVSIDHRPPKFLLVSVALNILLRAVGGSEPVTEINGGTSFGVIRLASGFPYIALNVFAEPLLHSTHFLEERDQIAVAFLPFFDS